MEVSDYLGYIAYFYTSIDSLTPKHEYVDFLKSRVGPTMARAALPKLRDTARQLYKGYVASAYSRYGAFYLSSKLDKDIDQFIVDTIALNSEYGVFYDTIDYDLTPVVMDRNIKRFALANYKVVLAKLFDEKAPPKATATRTRAPRKTKATGARKTKTTAAKKVPSPIKAKKVIATKKLPPAPKKTTAAAKKLPPAKKVTAAAAKKVAPPAKKIIKKASPVKKMAGRPGVARLKK